ncbi:unnamed protein product [Ranitomeya imitator]|uniref:EamA domain-containing protein n=1 Tax=Ranitomeya imitator TaxID=111125 RepID=A0ABN9LJ60_9NEOB|nr:unnamed protein product [Ranitomeya imitator]
MKVSFLGVVWAPALVITAIGIVLVNSAELSVKPEDFSWWRYSIVYCSSVNCRCYVGPGSHFIMLAGCWSVILLSVYGWHKHTPISAYLLALDLGHYYVNASNCYFMLYWAVIVGPLIVFETLAALAYSFMLRHEWPPLQTAIGIICLVVGVVLSVRAKPTPPSLASLSE